MNIGLLGHGVVGGGVDLMCKERDDMQVTKVLDLVVTEEIKDRIAKDIDEIVNDPSIDTVVEVMGGTEPAFTFVKKALETGKNVVTSNKALVAKYYKELCALAKEHQVAFRSTAAVGGGIPWLVNLERAKRLDKISEIGGIMNGTTNFILNNMYENAADFDAVLKEAQDLGYAERDPSADIDGLDVRRKIDISMNVTYGVLVPEEDIPTFGIRSCTLKDVENIKELGYILKLMAFASSTENGIASYVEPTCLSMQDPTAHIPLNYNLLYYMAENGGKQSFIGEGAGRFPTAYNVMQDLIDVANGTKSFYADQAIPTTLSNDQVCHTYYVRTNVPSTFLDSITAEKKADFILTKPVSVSEMHAFAKAHLEQDSTLFIAGIQ